jgi:hypothetical protein
LSIRRRNNRNNIDNSSPKSAKIARAIRANLHNDVTDNFISQARLKSAANWNGALPTGTSPPERAFRSLIGGPNGADIKKLLRIGVNLVNQEVSDPENPSTWEYRPGKANAAKNAGYILPPLGGDNGVKLPNMGQRVTLARTYVDSADSVDVTRIVVFPIPGNVGPYSVNQGLSDNQTFVYTDDTDKGKPVHIKQQCTIFTNKPSVNFFKSSYLRYGNFQRADHVLDASTHLHAFKTGGLKSRGVPINNTWGADNGQRHWVVPLKNGAHGNVPKTHTHLSNIVMRSSLVVNQTNPSGTANLTRSYSNKTKSIFYKEFWW